ncbi:hypothetical protein U1Q18_036735 [Sarracenia purpurea var. burkii]
MRSRSSRAGSKGGMEIHNNHDNKLKEEEPHLSGAYIRSLVKQLTSSRTKDPINPKHHSHSTSSADGDGFLPCPQNLTKFGEEAAAATAAPLALALGEGQPSSLPPQLPHHHKKQVRRRLHTSRPYQERLLNMAEARREIVTALKFHRAAMRQANEQQPPPPPPQEAQLQPQPLSQPPGKTKSRRNPRIYPSSNSTAFSNYLENNTPYSTFCCSSKSPYSWPPASKISLPAINSTHENLNLTLPNQTLGLNLNIHEFNNLDATPYSNSNNPSVLPSWLSPSSSSSSSSSPSPSPSLFVAAGGQEKIPTAQVTPTPVVDANITDPSMMRRGGLSLHPTMDDEEMAEIRSIGEQHEVEWNDTLNLVTSAWWFKFLKTSEIGPQVRDKHDHEDDDDDGYNPFDQLLEFPAWLNANDTCFHQRYLIDHCSDDYFQDPALPW